MFVGHYGVSFAAKKVAPSVPLWVLFIAVQLLDVAWAPLVLLGIEKVRIVPGITASNPLDLYYMPYTHSLVAALLWSAGAFIVYRLAMRRDGTTAALIVGAAVFSHWVLDFVVHRPDLPLYDDTAKVGLGLWNLPAPALGLEASLVFAGMWLYVRTGAARRIAMAGFCLVMLAIQIYIFFGPPPASDKSAAGTAIAVYVVFAAVIRLLESGPPKKTGTRRRHAETAFTLAVAFLTVAASTVSLVSAARLRLPPHGGRSVHDLSGVLSAGSIEIMERRHAELYEKTGVALVVITIGRLEDETLSDFAVRVGSEWGVGKKGQDRGIVVAVTTDEPHVFVATGYGVEGFLPDGRVGAILDRYVVPALRNRDFDTALLQASQALVAVCAAEFRVTIGGVEPAPAGPPGALRSLPLGLIVLFAVLVMIVFRMIILPLGRGGRYRGVWYGGGFGGGGFGGGGFGGGGGGFGGFGGGGFGGGGAGR